MPGIARVGVDSAGGIILGGGNHSVFVNGSLAAVKGDSVAGHGKSPHSAPVMVGSSNNVFCEEWRLLSCVDDNLYVCFCIPHLSNLS